MHLKKLLCAGLLTGVVALGSMTGFAFDMLKEADTVTQDSSVIYTMYLGMPEDEFKDNFSGVTGWDYWDSTMLKNWDSGVHPFKAAYESGINPFRYEYKRKESFPGMKGITQSEILNAYFCKGRPLEQLHFVLAFDSDVELSNKQVMKVIEEGEKPYKVMFNNLVNQFGKAESSRRSPIISPINGVQFGDSLTHTWKAPNGSYYSLSFYYCFPSSMKKAHAVYDQKDNHMVWIILNHWDWAIMHGE